MNNKLEKSCRQFLSVDVSNCLKGIFAVMVLLTHMHGRVTLFSNSIVGTLFSAFGYLAVSGFFFLSGFGLTEQSKKEGYIKAFPKRKVLPFYLLCCVSVLIYLLRDIIFANQISLIGVVKSFLWGDTVVENGWYLQAQLLFYIFFYLSFRFAKKHKEITLFVLLFAYVVICFSFKYASPWYEASFAFLAGMIVSQKKERIEKFLKKNSTAFVLLAILMVVFVVALFFGNKPYLPETLRIIVKMISSVLFVLVVLTAVSKIKVECPLTRFLGKYSLGIYVIQGIFLTALRPIIQNDWLYILAVIITVIAAAIPTELLFKTVLSFSKKIFKN